VQKTKLGISVGMMGAALYFLGYVNFLCLVILAGYVLLFESNEWLKRTAVKAVAIVIGFSLISLVVGFGNDIFSTLNGILSWFDVSDRLSWPAKLDTIILNTAEAAEKLILLILGIKAFKQSSFTVKPIDNVINKNM